MTEPPQEDCPELDVHLGTPVPLGDPCEVPDVEPFPHDLSNIVLYLETPSGDIEKIRIEDFPDGGAGVRDVNDLDLGGFINENYDGAELVAITIKAGDNHVDGYGPGEGELFIVDGQYDESSLPMAEHMDAEYSFGQAFDGLATDGSGSTSGTSGDGSGGYEVPITIETNLDDDAGSDDDLSFTVRDLPDGAELSAGTDNGDGSWSLNHDQIDGLTITVPDADTLADLSPEVVMFDAETGREFTTTALPGGDDTGTHELLDASIDGTNALSGDQGFTISARNIDGEVSTDGVYVGPEGIGVEGAAAGNVVPNQIGHDPVTGNSEEIIIEFEYNVSELTFEAQRLFLDEGDNRGDAAGHEEGHYTLLRDGEVVGEGDFTANSGTHTGSYTVEVPDDGTFDQIIFSANPYTGGDGTQTGDSSDYFVKSIEYTYEDPLCDVPPVTEPPVTEPPAPSGPSGPSSPPVTDQPDPSGSSSPSDGSQPSSHSDPSRGSGPSRTSDPSRGDHPSDGSEPHCGDSSQPDVDAVANPTAVTAVLNADVVEAPCGEQTIRCFEADYPPGSDNAGDIQQVQAVLNETTGELTFTMVIEPEADGFTLALNDGPNPKGHAGELGLFYFDGSGADPTVTAYAYNGQNTQTSWRDGSPESGQQDADPIATSLDPDGPFSDIEVSINDDGAKVMTFTVDSNVIGDHVPANPGPGGTDEWSGATFGEQLGIWLHPVSGLESSYGDDGYLDQWSVDSQGWYDTANQETELKTEPILAPEKYTVSAEIDAYFGDYVDGSEQHFVWVEIPDGWTLTDGDYDLTAGTDGGQFARIEVDSSDLIAGDGMVTVPLSFDVPLDAGNSQQSIEIYAEAIEEALPGETDYDNNTFVSGGTLTFGMEDLLDDDGYGGSWVGEDTGENENFADPMLSGADDFFLFSAFDGVTFGEDGEPTKWTDLIEAGFGDGDAVNVEEAGWTSDIEDGAPDDDDEPDRDDRITTEETDDLDEIDKVEW